MFSGSVLSSPCVSLDQLIYVSTLKSLQTKFLVQSVCQITNSSQNYKTFDVIQLMIATNRTYIALKMVTLIRSQYKYNVRMRMDEPWM